MNGSVRLALADAANNCARESNVVAELTLRSGKQFRGKLDKGDYVMSVMLREADGGWITIETDEIVAVRSYRA